MITSYTEKCKQRYKKITKLYTYWSWSWQN